MDETKTTNIFLSWSKTLAKEIAELFKADLEFIFGSRVNVFLSSDDIKPGEKSIHEINKKLSITNYGVFFMTEENLSSPWVYYEAGAVAKDEQVCRVMILRINVDNSALQDTPLQQYQNCPLNEEGYKKIFMGIYGLCPERDKETTILERITARWKKGREYENLLAKYGQAKDKLTEGNKNSYEQINTMLNNILNLIKDNSLGILLESQAEILRLLQDMKKSLDNSTYRDSDIDNIQRENSYISMIVYNYSQLVDKINDNITKGDMKAAKSNIEKLQAQIKTFLADLYDSAKV